MLQCVHSVLFIEKVEFILCSSVSKQVQSYQKPKEIVHIESFSRKIKLYRVI